MNPTWEGLGREVQVTLGMQLPSWGQNMTPVRPEKGCVIKESPCYLGRSQRWQVGRWQVQPIPTRGDLHPVSSANSCPIQLLALIPCQVHARLPWTSSCRKRAQSCPHRFRPGDKLYFSLRIGTLAPGFVDLALGCPPHPTAWMQKIPQHNKGQPTGVPAPQGPKKHTAKLFFFKPMPLLLAPLPSGPHSGQLSPKPLSL